MSAICVELMKTKPHLAIRRKSWRLPDLNGPLLCTKTQVCLNLTKEKKTKRWLFSCGNEISVLKNVYRSTDFKAELSHQLVRLVTETSQVVLLFVCLFFCLSVFIWSVLLILFLFENILTCKDEKDFYTFLLPMKFPKSVFYWVLRTKTSALQYSWFTYGYMPHALYALQCYIHTLASDMLSVLVLS